MKCSEFMTTNPACCLPGDTVDKAAQLMKREDVGPVPVIDSQQTKRLIGIVTDRDLALTIVADGRDAKSTQVEAVMTRDLITCREDDDLQAALAAMGEHQVRRIPIVDGQNRLVGIIAQADVATRVGHEKETGEIVEQISKSRAKSNAG